MIVMCNGILLTSQVVIADTFKKKLIGLLGRSSIDETEGLLLQKCSSIHCFFMRFTIDAIYISKNMTVIDKETLKPWKIGKIVKNAYHVLELKEGASKEVKIGDTLLLKDYEKGEVQKV